MYLLGITGKKGSGKDTVYGILKELILAEINSQWKVERVAFADALKEEVARACGVTVDYINANKSNFRLILQGWGTEFRRELTRKDYWVYKWGQKINGLSNNVYLAVATDVRYHNEAKIIHDCDGKIIRVTRYYSRPELDDTHSSEIEQDSIQADFAIINNGTLEDLRQSVKACLVEIKSKYIHGNKYVNSADSTRARVIYSEGLPNPS